MRPKLVLFLACGGTLGACSGSHESAHTTPASVASAPRKSEVVLDVPGLLNLPMQALNQRLGPQLPVPAGFSAPVLLLAAKTRERLDSVALFRYRGLALVASHNHETGRVNNLQLLGPNEQQLMDQATRLLGVRVLATVVGRQSVGYWARAGIGKGKKASTVPPNR